MGKRSRQREYEISFQKNIYECSGKEFKGEIISELVASKEI